MISEVSRVSTASHARSSRLTSNLSLPPLASRCVITCRTAAVKPALAAKYGVPTEMTEARKQGIEEHKGLMLDKRKKWRGNDDADSPSTVSGPAIPTGRGM